MRTRALSLIAVLGCLVVAPLTAQEPQASPITPARQGQTPSREIRGGPQLVPAYPRYEPAITQPKSLMTTAAADRVTITITTLGLVLLILLLVLLIA
jgi:hypothetical protein